MGYAQTLALALVAALGGCAAGSKLDSLDGDSGTGAAAEGAGGSTATGGGSAANGAGGEGGGSAGTCGDGVLDDDEHCDTAIASGEGMCPETCNDEDACTSDTLTGAACQAMCVHQPVAPSHGDGCCPKGADTTTDDDCEPLFPTGPVVARCTGTMQPPTLAAGVSGWA